MSRRPSSQSVTPEVSPPAVARAREPVTLRWVRAVLRLPRVVRIILIAVFAIVVTFALSPVIDAVYLNFFFDETTRVLPSLAAAGAGLVMYVLGWVLVVGTVGEELPERIAVLWYIGLGLLAIVLVTIMLLAGWMSGNAPTL